MNADNVVVSCMTTPELDFLLFCPREVRKLLNNQFKIKAHSIIFFKRYLSDKEPN